MKAFRTILAILLIFTFLLTSCDLLIPSEDVNTPLSEADADATVAAIVSGTQTAQAESEGDPPPDPIEDPTDEPTPEPSATTAPTPEPLLPQALVFLTREGGQNFKIARFDHDGATLTYLTTTPEEIRGFAINPVDGTIAYIANNTIYHMNADGSGKYILIAGVAPAETDDYRYMQSFYGLAWSPDGLSLAFGRGGLNMYDMGTGMITNLVVNTLNAYGPEKLHFPALFSPDGTKLLVEIGWMEAGTLGVYNFSDSSYLEMTGSICCDFDWTLNSNKILVANPYLGLLNSGFWTYNATNGNQQILIADAPGTFYSPGFPKKLANGEINLFMATSATMPEGYFDLYMSQSVGGDVTNTILLNPTGYPVIDAAWTSDGVHAAVVVAGPGNSWNPSPLKIISADGTPEITVHTNAISPAWVP